MSLSQVDQIIGAIAVYVIDHKFKHAAIYALVGGIFTFFGIINAEAIGIGAAWEVAFGYAILAVMFIATHFMKDKKEQAIDASKDVRG